MKNIKFIKKRLEELKPSLEDKFQVKSIGIFGSYVRGEQNNKSDVDVLVDFANDAHIGLLKYLEMEIFLSDSWV